MGDSTVITKQDNFDRIYKYLKYLEYDWGHKNFEKYFSLRKSGHKYTMQEHLESMVVSLLSANRPWGPIEENLDNLKEIFKGYDPELLYKEDPDVLSFNVQMIGCGNRRIQKQMEELRYNINVFKRIENDFGDVDYFASLALTDIERACMELSGTGSYYKLKGVGDALVFQYLKQLGVDCVKPDVHLLRIIPRLGYLDEGCKHWDVYYKCKEIADKYPELYMADVGAILWCFCAVDYLNVCGADPHCLGCPVQCQSSFGIIDDTKFLVDTICCYDFLMWQKMPKEKEEKMYKELGTDEIIDVARYLREKNNLCGNWY